MQVKTEPTADYASDDDKNSSCDNYHDSYYHEEGGMYTEPDRSFSYTGQFTDDAATTQVQYRKRQSHKVMLAKLPGSLFTFIDHLIVENDCVACHRTCDKEVT